MHHALHVGPSGVATLLDASDPRAEQCCWTAEVVGRKKYM